MKLKLVLLMLCAASIMGQNKTFTLDESMATGLSNSKEIQIAESKLRAAEAQITEVGSQMLPQISFGANYTRLSDVPPFEVNVPISPNPIKIQDVILNNYGLQVGVQQPLFTGFRLSSLKSAAEYNRDAIEVELNKAKNEKALEIQKSFWNYYKTQIAVKLIKESLSALQNHLKDTEAFLKNGLVTTNDLLKLKVQVSNIQLKLIDTQNMMKVAQSVFNKSIGLELNADTEITVSDLNKTEATFNYDELLGEALNNREEIKSMMLKTLAGEESVDAANAGWYPQLYAFGNFYYTRPNQRLLPLEDKFYDTWDAGVMLKWNLWDWGKTSSQAEQAEEQVTQAKKGLALLKEGVELEVYSNYLKMKSSVEKVDVAELASESAKENYRITEKKYEQQLATSTDLIDAQLELLNAKTNYENALIDQKIIKTELLKSIGRKIY